MGRVHSLKQIKNALVMFKTKIRYTYEPLTNIFTDISKTIGGKTGEIFKTVVTQMENENASNSWENAIEKSDICITREDKQTLKGLGKLLGKTDLEGQINEIELTINFLDTQIEKAEREKEKNAKLYKTLGIVSGLGIVIILI